MKRILLVGLVVASLGLLVIGFAIPVFAHGPQEGEAAPTDQEAWEAMYQACVNGDWEAMAEAAEQVHGEYFGHMGDECHGYPDTGWDAMDGDVGGGMMGGGWGGMMGWR